MTKGKRMGDTVIIHGNPNHSGYATFCIPAVDLNLGNKTANINVENCSLSRTNNAEMTHWKQQK